MHGGRGFLEHAACSEESIWQNHISNMPDLANTVPNSFPVRSVVRRAHMPPICLHYDSPDFLATKEKAGVYLAVREWSILAYS
jgi:hypothetical protein